MSENLNKIFKNSKRLIIDDNTKIVIMSDCHRGSGNNSDNFIKNKNIFKAALNDYYDRGFTYIEVGDGDDMWEVKNYDEIIREHLDVFKILRKFKNFNRLFMIYGNHDKCKKSKYILEKYFYKYYDEVSGKEEALLDNLEVSESLVLVYKGNEIFIVHGHQGDFLNDDMWSLSRFLVRYVWKNFEKIGIKDPTSAAKNYRITKKTEKRLKKWSCKNNKIVIAGHTHRPIFPKVGNSLYFNDGSCIHPSGITCLEIENGNISLVKWSFMVRDDKVVYVGKKILKNSVPIQKFFTKCED